MNERPGPNGVVVKVGDSLYKVSPAFFSGLPDTITRGLGFTTGKGQSMLDPVILSGHSAQDFEDVLEVYSTFPEVDYRSFRFEQLLTIAELSYAYHLEPLKLWAIDAVTMTVNDPTTPLRTSTAPTFARILALAMTYQRPELSLAVQRRWLLRIYCDELGPTPAIAFAEKHSLRHFLGHALYTYLLRLAPSSEEGGYEQVIETSSTLDPKLTKHLLSGYYSLLAFSKQLQRSPPAFEEAEGCLRHGQCIAVWKIRWTAAITRPCALSAIDLFSRFRFVERCLQIDMILDICMSASCQQAALGTLVKLREQLSNNLHHHFDL